MELRKLVQPIKGEALAVLALAMVIAVPAPAQNVLTAAQWRQDLHTLATQIPKLHHDAFHDVSREEFDAAVAGLDNKIPQLSDHEIVVEFAKIVAMLHEGHSRLSLPGLPDPMSDSAEVTPAKYARLVFSSLPLRLYSFRDGLFVVAATAEYRELIGAQVLQIGDRPVSEVIKTITPVLNHDNEAGISLLAAEFIVLPDVLRALHVVPDVSRISLRCRTSRGKDVTVELKPIPDQSKAGWLQVYDAMRISSPLYLHQPDKNYWFEYLADSRTEFVRINKIQNSPDETVAKFANRLYSDIDLRMPNRLVIDLRDCHGGDNQLFRSLLLGLIREQRVDRPGRLFVIMGRATFSAAVNAVVDLEHLTNTILVGESPSGAPNSWGDPKRITLPNSGLIARISTIYWRDWSTDPSRAQIVPDIPELVSSADYFSGVDPFLKAILAFPQQTAIGDVLENVARAGGGVNSVIRLYYREKTDPVSADESTQSAMERLLKYLVLTKSYDEAFLIIRINAFDYPESLANAKRILRESQEADQSNGALSDFVKKVSDLKAGH